MKRLAKSLLILSLVVLPFYGCTTPRVTNSTEASFDGNNQNSGLLRFLPDGSLEITQAAKDRFDALGSKYGDRLLPPFKKNYGCERLPSGTWKISMEAAEVWHKLIGIKKLEEINTAK